MLFSVNDVWVHYGQSEVIHGISLQIEEKVVVSIIGANGAGKSTVLKAIMGIKVPTKGEIWFQGNRIDHLPVHEIVRCGLALVPEGKRLFQHMTVLQNLKLGAYSQKTSRSEMRDGLDGVFGYFPILGNRRTQKAGTLSGGEQQMLSIGRALMARPKLLLMDEPSQGLAPVMVGKIAQAIASIAKQSVCILLVEQNVLLALNVANETYVLENGIVVSHGNTNEIVKIEDVRRAYLGG